jgi:uncharacterized membrane protein YgdD (TMEM256/DUF423 family)
MTKTSRQWIFVAAVTGALAVVVGAFGAHAVPAYLQSRALNTASIAERLENFNIAARYHMYGALFLFGIALLIDRWPSRALSVAAWCMLFGILVFSGAVYAVALVPDEMRGTFGMLAPVGGTLMIAGWVALAVGVFGAKE